MYRITDWNGGVVAEFRTRLHAQIFWEDSLHRSTHYRLVGPSGHRMKFEGQSCQQ